MQRYVSLSLKNLNCLVKRNSCSQLEKLVRHLSNKHVKQKRLCVPLTTKDIDQITLINQLSVPFSTTFQENDLVDYATFEKVCEETLESLSEYFEEIVEGASHLKSSDVSYSSGVLTVNFGEPYGTYVINRQSPNRQIWLSSPTSGPKRYDYIADGEYWIYKHDGQTLHQLLQNEIPKIVKCDVNFSHCSYSYLSKT